MCCHLLCPRNGSTLTGILSGGGPLLEGGNQFIQETDFHGNHTLTFKLDADTKNTLEAICEKVANELSKWGVDNYTPTLAYSSKEQEDGSCILSVSCSDELVVREFCDAIQLKPFNFSMLVFGRVADELLSACEA